MTPITVMMMVTGECQGFFPFISGNGGGQAERHEGEVRGFDGVERGTLGHIGKRSMVLYIS